MKLRNMLSVIIPTRNRALELERCIKSIKNQTYDKYEIIVVDDNSSDETQKIIHKYKVRYIKHTERLGQSAGKNDGTKIAKGEVIVFTDDDCIADPFWLENIVKAFHSEKNIAVVGGKILNLGKTNINIHLLPIWPFIANQTNKTGRIIFFGITSSNFDSNSKQFVDWVSAGNMAIKKKVFDKVRGFNKNYIGNCIYEEPDICLRIKELKYKIYYQPLAICTHKPSSLNRASDQEIRYFNKSNEIYFQLKHLGIKNPINIILFFLYHIWDFTIEIVGLLKSKYCIYDLKGKIDGLKRSFQ